MHVTEIRELWVQSWRKVNSERCPGELAVPGQVGVGVTQVRGEIEGWCVWQLHL